MKFDSEKKTFIVSTNDFKLVGKYTIIVKAVNLRVLDVEQEPLLIDLEILDPCTETKFENADSTFINLMSVPEG